MPGSGKAPTRARNLVAVTGTGLKQQPASITSATSQAPIVGPGSGAVMHTLGVDAVMFSFPASATPSVLTFPNLPTRDNTANPLQPMTASRPPITIAPKDQLIFVVSLHGLLAPPGVNVTPSPQAIVAKSGLVVAGPFLGSNTYATFQATLGVIAPANTPGNVSGTVVGMLFLSVG